MCTLKLKINQTFIDKAKNCNHRPFCNALRNTINDYVHGAGNARIKEHPFAIFCLI